MEFQILHEGAKIKGPELSSNMEYHRLALILDLFLDFQILYFSILDCSAFWTTILDLFLNLDFFLQILDFFSVNSGGPESGLNSGKPISGLR